ncbi:ATP-binding protein [Candidatus Woesearchaeota archaeon]|nr:ATP-binding protein [Candidatus Woesearchaeota archaeon]
MAYDIIVGRNESDKKKFGNEGAVLLGKSYVQMGRTVSLSNQIFLDVVRSHVIYVVGKRGSGKSYSIGVVAEGISDLPEDIKKNISVIILDTMGIFWTMKYANQKDEDLLEQWGLKGKGLDVKIFTPFQYYKKYKEEGMPTDYPFSFKASDLTAEDWRLTFELGPSNPVSVAIAKILGDLQEKQITNYTITDLIIFLRNDKEIDQNTKNETTNYFKAAQGWGLFSNQGINIDALCKGGQVTVLDVSCYTTGEGGWGVKSLVVGLIAKKVFVDRMISRKKEELEAIQTGYSYFKTESEAEIKERKPLVWLLLDESHEFLPKEGKSAATDALITLLREGRQPGVSLILATQQPGKIHGDVMTQSDIVLSHRITARPDVDALNSMTQSYLAGTVTENIDKLPRENGAAVILDDNSERLYQIRVRPRFTWHGGESPTAIKVKRKLELGV